MKPSLIRPVLFISECLQCLFGESHRLELDSTTTHFVSIFTCFTVSILLSQLASASQEGPLLRGFSPSRGMLTWSAECRLVKIHPSADLKWIEGTHRKEQAINLSSFLHL